MRKKLMILLSLLAAAAMLASCMTSSPTAAPTAAPTPPPAASTAPPATPAPTLAPTATAAPAPSSAAALIREDTPIASATDVRDANIVSVKARSDGQVDITFDFVDWLSGDTAKAQYLLDNPGATDDEMEDAGLMEVGYIRDKSHATFAYHTGPSTQFLLPTADNPAVNAPVAFSEFKSRMDACLAGSGEDDLKFVKISVDGDTIVKIEYNYRP